MSDPFAVNMIRMHLLLKMKDDETYKIEIAKSISQCQIEDVFFVWDEMQRQFLYTNITKHARFLEDLIRYQCTS